MWKDKVAMKKTPWGYRRVNVLRAAQCGLKGANHF